MSLHWLDNADSWICPVCGFETGSPTKYEGCKCPTCGFQDEKDAEPKELKKMDLVEVPFNWNDNFSEIAQEDFSAIQKDLPYCTCQSIGLALAKLQLLEKQGCKVEVEDGKDDLYTKRI